MSSDVFTSPPQQHRALNGHFADSAGLDHGLSSGAAANGGSHVMPYGSVLPLPDKEAELREKRLKQQQYAVRSSLLDVQCSPYSF